MLLNIPNIINLGYKVRRFYSYRNTTISSRCKSCIYNYNTNTCWNRSRFMYVNNDKFLESTSNECNVQLKMPSQNELIITPESQRISTFISENKNIISSIASIERSNSSILSGEADLLSSSKKILFIN